MIVSALRLEGGWKFSLYDDAKYGFGIDETVEWLGWNDTLGGGSLLFSTKQPEMGLLRLLANPKDWYSMFAEAITRNLQLV